MPFPFNQVTVLFCNIEKVCNYLFQVHDYLDVVKHPMDLSTMRQKAQTHQYRSVDQFVQDFELMVQNCLTYNAKETIFYRAAVKLRDHVSCYFYCLLKIIFIDWDPVKPSSYFSLDHDLAVFSGWCNNSTAEKKCRKHWIRHWVWALVTTPSKASTRIFR